MWCRCGPSTPNGVARQASEPSWVTRGLLARLVVARRVLAVPPSTAGKGAGKVLHMGSIHSPHGAGPPGSLRVCLGSFTQPWSFGPYARQLTVLAGQLAKKHVVMWLSLGYHDTEVRIKVPGLPENVGMLGGGFPRNQGVYVSSINSLLKQHNMDVFISLMDLNRMPHRP